MNLRGLNIKKCYNSDRDNPLRDFYIPVLSTAKMYKRITGSFTSGILSKAAQGIAGLINNNGRMRLIAGAQITEEDYRAIEGAIINPEKFITDLLNQEIGDIENYLRDDHVEALAWMLANGLLEMKIGIVPPGNLSHMKVGIVKDTEGVKLSFSGSNNETPSGWEHNVEEFKVFCEWIDGERGYFEDDERKFDDLWSGKAKRACVVTLPTAIKEKLIQTVRRGTKPKLVRQYQDTKESGTNIGGVRKEEAQAHILATVPPKIELRTCQKEGIKFWFANKERGILSMATGSGKTKTALAIVKKVFESGKMISIIAVPREHLVKQWINNDIRPMFPDAHIVEVHGGADDWRKKIKLILPGFTAGTIKHLFIVGLYGSLASKDYIEAITLAKIDSRYFVYVADEVHNSGAPESRGGLLDIYSKRIGLSATPERYFDEEGTDFVVKYFDKVVYEYTIKDAIKDGYLTPYNYYPVSVYLYSEEYEEYALISEKISRKIAFENSREKDIFKEDDIKMLLLKRSKILKNAKGKIEKFAQILNEIIDKLQNKPLSHLLIYCDDKKQVGSIQEVLNRLNILNHKFTEEESSEERQNLLESFSQGRCQALVAVKCLDEGIDVPESRIAIIIASTTNPREYIQRRGRVLRKAVNKLSAEIYDLFVLPPDKLTGSIDKAERAILQKEFERVRDFVNTSQNPSDSYQALIDVMKKYNIYL